MNISKGLKEKLDVIFSEWIKIMDARNPFTIDIFPYSTGVIPLLTVPHCGKCTSINYCWFKNEKGKKPENFNYNGMEIQSEDKGLYHPHCHCVELPLKTPEPSDIKLIIPNGKIEYTIKNKKDWIKSMGYYNTNNFINVLLNKTKEAYIQGDYVKLIHNNYGFKININVFIPGINDKYGKLYKIKTAYMVFSNEKLKNNTLLGGWAS